MKKTIINTALILGALLLNGCAMSQQEMFVHYSKKHNVNPKTIKAICKAESGLRPYVVNVNKSIFDIQRGPHYFDTWIGANTYMDFVLDPLMLNYDVGLCQINKAHLSRMGLDNEDLLDPEKNIDAACKIYKWNVKKCKGDIMCALSMYNTGKAKCKTGYKYANKVLKIRKSIN